MYGSDGITVLRVFNLLTGDIYKKDQVGKLQFKYERMSMEELCDHLQDIQQAIQCEYLENEGANGMTVYLEQKNLKRQVLNMLPSAGLWEHQLWSVLEIRATETITKEEEAALIHMWEKQLTGDFGDRMLLTPISGLCNSPVSKRANQETRIRQEGKLKQRQGLQMVFDFCYL